MRTLPPSFSPYSWTLRSFFPGHPYFLPPPTHRPTPKAHLSLRASQHRPAGGELSRHLSGHRRRRRRGSRTGVAEVTALRDSSPPRASPGTADRGEAQGRESGCMVGVGGMDGVAWVLGAAVADSTGRSKEHRMKRVAPWLSRRFQKYAG